MTAPPVVELELSMKDNYDTHPVTHLGGYVGGRVLD